MDIIVVDSSALIAVACGEPAGEAKAERMANAKERLIGAPTLLETAMVLYGKWGEDAKARLGELSERFNLTPVDFTAEHWLEAREAFLRFGKGRHPARLNFGDCMAYALARVAGAPLLYTGDDFAKTDIEAA